MNLNNIEFKIRIDEEYGLQVKFEIDDNLTSDSIWEDKTNGHEVNFAMLLFSYFNGVSGYLFSCECGWASCAGINNECSIIHLSNYVVWLIPKEPFLKRDIN